MVSRLIALLLLIWLLVGAFAAYQRGYFSSGASNCAKTETVALTVVAGPLNYVGVNPRTECVVPKPSN